MLIQIPVSVGELVDKITILSIKTQRLEGVALDHVRQELGLLEKALVESGIKLEPRERADLEEVNKTLWNIEEAIRRQEAEQSFGTDFVALARSVYRWNDERAALKRAINQRYGSTLIEEKSYRSL